MKELPPVNSVAVVNNSGVLAAVKVVAHHEEHAVYVWHSNDEWHCRMNVAEDFELIAKESNPVKENYPLCYSGTSHNYVQIEGAHENGAFCTRCGRIITLE